LASDGTGYLVVWDDSRSGNLGIYGTRVTAGGDVLDPAGIPIFTYYPGAYSPEVSFDGTNYLVSWIDVRNGHSDVFGRRVTTGGDVLDPPEGIAIAVDSTSEQVVVQVSGAGNNLVVYRIARANGDSLDLFGARVTPAGQVLDSLGLPIACNGLDQEYDAGAAFDGVDYLVAWRCTDPASRQVIRCARFSPDLVPLDSQPVDLTISTGTLSGPSVAFDGTKYIVIWTDSPTSAERRLQGATVTPDGVLGETLTLAASPDLFGKPAVASDRTGHTLAAFGSWVGLWHGRYYNARRIRGTTWPLTGVAERGRPLVACARPLATIVRGVLMLPATSSSGTQTLGCLLDVSGRTVLDLQPGANDVRTLAPGVYFVREEPSAVSRERAAVCKVIVTR